MPIDVLGVTISFAGLIFFGITLAIIILGKKVGDEKAGPQRISVGKYVELRTNAVLTLAMITLVPAVGPLALKTWKPDLTNYVTRDEVSRLYLPIKDLSLTIHGSVLLETKDFAANVGIEVVRTTPDTMYTQRYETDEQGQFYIELNGVRPKEHYDITWTKSGYGKKRLKFGFNEIPFPLVLSREGAEK